ncbi:MAG: ribonuclease HII [Saprospiraceae bacterium]|uniref:Ribonuclease HII n=1 Tax=Candidatus Opimibacter skivensis TaxID=2982028 RepID=A0A9D7STA9_9BACT|nr:ribonuclease HII [Candidatus Opimibacter skivensis]
MAKLKSYLEKGRLEAGCDEAGRGCFAGPVFAAAVILPHGFRCPGLNDSKKISAERREEYRIIIEKNAIAWAVASIDSKVIDRINILRASIQAMHNALRSLTVRPEFIIVDGNRFYPFEDINHECIVEGDAKFRSIAAASILAKTHRDAHMRSLHELYPQYGWNQNKGYGTEIHRAAIVAHGITPEHRVSFKFNENPVQLDLFEETIFLQEEIS